MVDILKGHVGKKIGALAGPEQILFTAELPKTRSGKIMRRLLWTSRRDGCWGIRRRWPIPRWCTP